MVKHQGGSRRKTRSKFRKSARQKGKISISRYLQSFAIGDRVQLSAEPAVQRSFYHTRFHGKSGIVSGKRGRCYEVDIKDFNKKKMLVIHPVHLRRA